MALAIEWSNIVLPGLGPRLLGPVIRWAARRAEASGLGRELRERYECE